MVQNSISQFARSVKRTPWATDLRQVLECGPDLSGPLSNGTLRTSAPRTRQKRRRAAALQDAGAHSDRPCQSRSTFSPSDNQRGPEYCHTIMSTLTEEKKSEMRSEEHTSELQSLRQLVCR